MLIYSGRPSDGAKNLAKALGIRRATENGRVLPANTVVINWGNTQMPARFRNCRVINKPEDVAVVANKLTFFRAVSRGDDLAIVPPWSSTHQGAINMMTPPLGHTKKMVCRRVLNGSGGAGIVIAQSVNELVPAPLYVEYIFKQEEYRVHILNENIIDIQRKARRKEVANPNWEVRNLEGGFIYARGDLHTPVCVTDVALACMKELDLDFGAVDVVWNAKQNRAYVLEVNSAPGLEGTTVTNYANAFKELAR